MSTGYITVKVFTADKAMPVPKAQIRIVDLRIALDQTIYADSYGNAERIKVYAPDKATSLKPQDISLPYETYNIEIIKEGYIPTVITNVPVFAGETCLQHVAMIPQPTGQDFANLVNNIEIPPNGLQLKIERPRAPMSEPQNSAQARQVVIPDFIRVHLGDPDSDEKTVIVPFCDYIKNVASSEVYATWPKESLTANILAIISYALNRIYTGFYPSMGKDFDITSKPELDPYYVEGRNIYGNICDMVDGVFNIYIKRTGSNTPLLANYCNGITNRCEGISQWGSVTLANQGQTAEDILKYYYGNVQTESAKGVKGVEKEFKSLLRLGDVGEHIMAIQKQLNQIGKTYKNIPDIPKENGNFDAYTQDAVRAFQKQFSMHPDGIVGKKTWYQIAFVYNAVKRLSELSHTRQSMNVPETAPGSALREGSTGADVRLLQYLLGAAGIFYNSILPVAVSGTYDQSTVNAVKSFQKTLSLQQTGTVDKNTWNALLNVYKGIEKQFGSVLDNFEAKDEQAGDMDKTIHHGKAKSDAHTVPPVQPDTGAKTRTYDSARQSVRDENRLVNEDRIRAAMNYANMDYKIPPRGTMNMAYSSEIKDYIPESSMDRSDSYTGLQKYQTNVDEKKENQTSVSKKEEGITGSAPPREKSDAQPDTGGQKTGYKPMEGQKFPYTPWMTEPQTGKPPAGQGGLDKRNMFGQDGSKKESSTRNNGQEHAGTGTKEGMRGENQTKQRMSKEETIPAAYKQDPVDQGMQCSPYMARVGEYRVPFTRPGTSISLQTETKRPGMERISSNEQRQDTGTERDFEPEQYPGAPARPGLQAYPFRMPGTMSTGMPMPGIVPPDDDSNEAYTCPNPPVVDSVYPNTVLKIGSKGKNVQLMQEYLSYIALSLMRYKLITNELKVIVNDGNYGIDTTDAVIRFQNRYEMPVNGVIDAATWAKIIEVYNNPCE
ncbi:MAG: peptidoglycan-binding protein [Eubacteriales bacterium]